MFSCAVLTNTFFSFKTEIPMLEKYSTAAARGTVDIFYPLLLVPTTLRPPTIGQPSVKVVSD